MVVQKFVFRENWVGSKVVAGMKIFFAIFDPIWTHTLAWKDPNKEYFKHNFSFQSINKKDGSYIIITFVTLGLTNQSEIFENNQFLAIFDPIQAKFWS